MKSQVSVIVLLVAFSGAFSQVSTASVIFRPKEKVKYVAPGDEEISGDAQQLFEIAQKAEKENDTARAAKAYKTLVKKYRKDALAPWAAFRAAQLWEGDQDYLKAAGAYRSLVDMFPASPYFEPAIEAQFRIGEMYLVGKKMKILGVPVADSGDHAIEIFAGIVRVAPYGKYTARAQFNIGLAREKQGHRMTGPGSLSGGGRQISERSDRRRGAISNWLHLVHGRPAWHKGSCRDDESQDGFSGFSLSLSE